MSRRALAAAAAGLTALAFVLRVRGMGQSLFGDEVLTYQIIDHASLVDVLRALRAAPESTPPLHYALAWASGGISGALTDIRLPSLVAGSATVPLLLAVGRRLVPARAAWLAAAAFALSPFATLYATETRAYALVTAATTAALLLLLRAVERSSTGRWAAFAAAGTVALYAHYTAVLVLGVAALWAWFARPDRRRALLLAHAAVVVLYLPWLPFLEGNQLNLIALTYPLTPSSFLEALVRLFAGSPFLALGTLPGTVALVLGGAALALGSATAVRARPATAPSARALIAGLALAAPLGLLLYYALTGTDLVNPRNLSVSAPALFLGVALVLTARRSLAPLTAGLALAALAIGAVGLQEPDARRPETAAVAAVIDARARPDEPVVESPLFGLREGPLRPTFALNLRRAHRLLEITGYRRRHDGVRVPQIDPRTFRAGRRVWVVGPERPGAVVLPPPPPGWRRIAGARYAGIYPYGYALYARARARPRSGAAGRRSSAQLPRRSSSRKRASTASVRRP